MGGVGPTSKPGDTAGLAAHDGARNRLRVELRLHDDADEQERALDAAKLRRRLLELDVDNVEVASAGPAPDGARAAGAMEIGALIVALASSPSLISSVGQVLSGWISSRNNRGAIVQLGDRRIELTGISHDDQMRLLRIFEEAEGGR